MPRFLLLAACAALWIANLAAGRPLGTFGDTKAATAPVPAQAPYRTSASIHSSSSGANQQSSHSAAPSLSTASVFRVKWGPEYAPYPLLQASCGDMVRPCPPQGGMPGGRADFTL